MTALDDARDALYTFAASQGWEIESRLTGTGVIVATIVPLAPTEVCSDCKRVITGGDFARLGLSMVLCSDCYEG